jgi:broad specificity phosphatase PhoE
VSGRLVLVRHGQSHANVDRRLDTRPPGAALTDQGRAQARDFAQSLAAPPGLLGHSIATRAVQTASEINTEITTTDPLELDGIHEVQVGDLEDRSDDAAHDEFAAVYRRWHTGDLDAAMPGGESGTDVLDRYVPVLDLLRLRYLDDDAWRDDVVVVSHGAAIRLVAAVLAGVDGEFALDHHLANTEAVILAPVTDGRWSCVQWGAFSPPFDPQTSAASARDAGASADPMG